MFVILKMYMFKFLFFFFFTSAFYAQNDKASQAFDSLFYHIAVNVIADNPQKALVMADSLYLNSNSGMQKLKSLMLSASVLEKSGERAKAIDKALLSLSIAEKTKDYVWQGRILGFLSTQYRHIGFLEQGKIYLEKGLELSSKMEDLKSGQHFRGLTYQEMAYYALQEKRFKDVISSAKAATLSYDVFQTEKVKQLYIASTEDLLGRGYMGIDEDDTAKHHFTNAIQSFKNANAERSDYAGLASQGLGSLYLKMNVIDSAGIYLKNALAIAESGDFRSLKEVVYRDISEYYTVLNVKDSASIYDKKYRDEFASNISVSKAAANHEFNRIKGGSEETQVYVYVVLVVIGLVLLSVVLMRYKKRRDLDSTMETVNCDTLSVKSITIPQDSENELLSKLLDFETSLSYLKPSISLSAMAVELDTNIKYLSHLIKTHRSCNFNTYINDLRINYILEKLKSNPEYRTYKISYLAEECGFSSHSKFSASFKRVCGLSPSEFIDSLSS